MYIDNGHNREKYCQECKRWFRVTRFKKHPCKDIVIEDEEIMLSEDEEILLSEDEQYDEDMTHDMTQDRTEKAQTT